MKRTATQLNIETLPVALRPYLKGAAIFDSSCSEAAQTYYLEGSLRAYLKTGASGTLSREREMTDFLHKQGLAPEVLSYSTEQGRDYLLTAALPGEDGISGFHLDNPYQLAAAFGSHLKQIHSLSIAECPVQNRTAEMLLEAEGNIARLYCDREIIPESVTTAATALLRLRQLAQADTVIHGDYCLPNIIMQDYNLSGFVDVGNGGIGDNHYDLFWGIWTLKYNLHTDKYRETFIAAYGREKVDGERLELCRLLAGFTE